MRSPTLRELSRPDALAGIAGPGRWVCFTYHPTALFSLKSSRATSTVGKTLLSPTLYAAKMAFVDVALRHGLTEDAEGLVHSLARARLRIGLPAEACVTGTIQRVRQETRAEDRKKAPGAPLYRTSIAMREVVHYRGTVVLAFDLATWPAGLTDLLVMAAPGINYLGKRGSFVQFAGCERRLSLDDSFTQPYDDVSGALPSAYHVTALDDFGPKASFDALNTFSRTAMKREVHRSFVETVVPLGVKNFGFGFVHYVRSGTGQIPRNEGD